jgi:hypothetical protein
MRYTLILSLLATTIFALEQQVATEDTSRVEAAVAAPEQKGGGGRYAFSSTSIFSDYH